MYVKFCCMWAEKITMNWNETVWEQGTKCKTAWWPGSENYFIIQFINLISAFTVYSPVNCLPILLFTSVSLSFLNKLAKRVYLLFSVLPLHVLSIYLKVLFFVFRTENVCICQCKQLQCMRSWCCMVLGLRTSVLFESWLKESGEPETVTELASYIWSHHLAHSSHVYHSGTSTQPYQALFPDLKVCFQLNSFQTVASALCSRLFIKYLLG